MKARKLRFEELEKRYVLTAFFAVPTDLAPLAVEAEKVCTFTIPEQIPDATLADNAILYLDPDDTPEGAEVLQYQSSWVFAWTPTTEQIRTEPYRIFVIAVSHEPLQADVEWFEIQVHAASESIPNLIAPTIAPSYPVDQELILQFNVEDEDTVDSHVFFVDADNHEGVSAVIDNTGRFRWTPDSTGTYELSVIVVDSDYLVDQEFLTLVIV